jgi:hypothetical protein
MATLSPRDVKVTHRATIAFAPMNDNYDPHPANNDNDNDNDGFFGDGYLSGDLPLTDDISNDYAH